MRILFMGTPEFAAVSLEYLLQNQENEIIGVVTQPDRPKGRGLSLQPSAVKVLATKHGLPLWQPEKITTPEFIALFKELAPHLVVVVAFGQKIPPEILFQPPYGCINVHGSLLPKYRGAAPIQRSIFNGDSVTGVTTMYMDEGWDTGDLIYQESVSIEPDETFGSLYQRLALLGGELLIKTIRALRDEVAPRLPQEDHLATKALKIKKEEELINWAESAQTIHNLVRTLNPQPYAETFWQKERLKVISTRLMADKPTGNLPPGRVIRIIKKQGILVATKDQPILLTEIKPEGKKMMKATDFANGRRLQPGMSFGS